MNKITTEQIEEQEKNMLAEAIGCEIELSDSFLDLYCSKALRDLLQAIPERERGFYLSGVDCECWFNGSPPSNTSQDIWLNVSEIEVQFEGEPEDYFESPDDFYISGDLAYLYVGYGLSIDYDLEELAQIIQEYQKE